MTVGVLMNIVVEIQDLLDRRYDTTLVKTDFILRTLNCLPTWRSRRDWCCETMFRTRREFQTRPLSSFDHDEFLRDMSRLSREPGQNTVIFCRNTVAFTCCCYC